MTHSTMAIKSKKRKGIGKKVLILCFWILAWEAVCLIINKEIYFPSPLSAFQALTALLMDSSSWPTILWSIWRTVLGIVLSLILGLALGMASGLHKNIYDLVNPLVVTLRATPVVSIIIIAIIWFSSTNVPIFACFLMCFPVIFTASVTGIRNTDPKLLEMCRVYQVNRQDVLRIVYLRSALPYINSGMVSSIGIAWKATAAAEVLSMPRYAIGSHLFFAKTALDPAALFAWTIVIIAISYLFESLYIKVSGYDKTQKRN